MDGDDDDGGVADIILGDGGGAESESSSDVADECGSESEGGQTDTCPMPLVEEAMESEEMAIETDDGKWQDQQQQAAACHPQSVAEKVFRLDGELEAAKKATDALKAYADEGKIFLEEARRVLEARRAKGNVGSKFAKKCFNMLAGAERLRTMMEKKLEDHTKAIVGLKDAVLFDIQTGDIPSTSFRKQLMYGLSCAPKCPHCGRAYREDEPTHQEVIVDYMFDSMYKQRPENVAECTAKGKAEENEDDVGLDASAAAVGEEGAEEDDEEEGEESEDPDAEDGLQNVRELREEAPDHQ